MQKEIIFVAGTLASIIAFADLGRKIENINQTLKVTGQQNPCDSCDLAQEKSDPESKMRECLQTLCPKNPEAVEDVQLKVYEKAAADNPTYNKSIQPLINQLAREAARENLYHAKQLLAFIDHPGIRRDDSARRIFNIFRISSQFDKLKFKADDTGNVIVDTAASRSAFADLNESQFQLTMDISNQFLTIFLNARPFPTEDSTRLKILYSESALQGKIKTAIANVTQKKQELQNNPDFKFLTGISSLFEQMSEAKLSAPFADGNIDSEGITNLNQTSAMLELLLQSSKDPKFKERLNSQEIDIKKFAERNGTVPILKERITKLQAALDSKGDIASFNCRYAYELAHQILISEQNAPTAMTALHKMQETFGDKTKDLVCPLVADAYLYNVKSWQPQIPETTAQFDRSLIQNLQSKLNDEKTYLKQWQDIEINAHRDDIYLIGFANISAEDNEVNRPSERLCKDLTPSYFPDATYHDSNGFIVGPSVLANIEKNKGITFHEMGHKLWAHFSSMLAMKSPLNCGSTDKWFRDVRACLRSNHTELTAEELQKQTESVQNDKPSQFEEEDWADLISTKVDDSSNNFACLFFGSTSASNPGTLSLRAADQDDHSSNLFRLLHLNFLKTGKVPAACEQALNARGEKTAFKNCLQSTAK